jgi:hypothetical protein
MPIKYPNSHPLNLMHLRHTYPILYFWIGPELPNTDHLVKLTRIIDVVIATGTLRGNQ